MTPKIYKDVSKVPPQENPKEALETERSTKIENYPEDEVSNTSQIRSPKLDFITSLKSIFKISLD